MPLFGKKKAAVADQEEKAEVQMMAPYNAPSKAFVPSKRSQIRSASRASISFSIASTPPQHAADLVPVDALDHKLELITSIIKFKAIYSSLTEALTAVTNIQILVGWVCSLWFGKVYCARRILIEKN